MKTTKQISIIVLTFACLFTSCKTTEEVTSSAPSPKDEITTEAPVVADPVAEVVVDTPTPVAREFFASIVKSPCFGKCPTYDMTIYADGFVELNGIRDVELIGKFTAQLTEAEVHKFRIWANRTGFMDMKESYDCSISDVPSATSTINLNGVTKSVFRRCDFPPSILQFEELFDALLKSKKWKAVKANQE